MSTGLWPTESWQLLALLGALGFAETAFLSYQKLVVGDLTALCTLGGGGAGGISARCGDVLNSEFASFMGVPLTLPAMLAYGTVAALAVRPLLLGEGTRERAEADVASRDPLLVRFCRWGGVMVGGGGHGGCWMVRRYTPTKIPTHTTQRSS